MIGPLLFVVGGTRANGALANSFAGIEKLLIIVSVLFITREAAMIADVLFAVLA